jgi:UDP-N-acetylglucosamine 2-epimerase (hydrolysing)
MRFEYFLTLLKNARFIIGNSSAGVREAPCYGVPSVNLGSRQFNRANLASILHTALDSNEIRRAIQVALQMRPNPMTAFGNGDSCRRFMDIIRDDGFWNTERQKFFVDRAILPMLAVARSQES